MVWWLHLDLLQVLRKVHGTIIKFVELKNIIVCVIDMWIQILHVIMVFCNSMIFAIVIFNFCQYIFRGLTQIFSWLCTLNRLFAVTGNSRLETRFMYHLNEKYVVYDIGLVMDTITLFLMWFCTEITQDFF